MTFKEYLINTIGCLLISCCCWIVFLGDFFQRPNVDVIHASTNKSVAPAEKSNRYVVFREEGGSLYAIAMKYYQKANETLFDIIVQANPLITDVRQIADEQKIIVPVINAESYIVKIKDGEYQVHIGTFETFELAKAYAQKLTNPDKLLFIEPQEFSPKDTWYRLTMGDFQHREEALKTITHLQKASLIYIPTQLK